MNLKDFVEGINLAVMGGYVSKSDAERYIANYVKTVIPNA